MTGDEAREEYASKWGMDETIWSKTITEDMNVLDYKKYIPSEYLPDGFDATKVNDYEKQNSY